MYQGPDRALCPFMTIKRLHLAALACPLAGVLALTAAAPALATDVAVSDTALRIIDTASENNAIEVRPGPAGYDIIDDLTFLQAGAGCVQVDPHRVGCPNPITAVAVGAGGGDDVADLAGVALPAFVLGGEGNDLIEGGSGDDVLDGGPGEDTIQGNGGSDRITGAGDDDALQGDAGGDRITGGQGADIVQGQGGSGDVLAGNQGMDLVEGGSGNDTMTGGSGADVLVTGSGTDKVSTGAGTDQVFGTPADKVDCSSLDEVTRGSQAPPDGCGRLPRSESKPDIWPPPPATVRPPDPGLTGDAPINDGALNAQAARLRLPLPKALVPGEVMHKGDARKIKLRIPSDYDMPIRVKIWVYAQDGTTLRSFREDVRAKRWVSVDTGADLAGAWSARVKCCVT
jgi:hypothetical protein